MEASRSPRSYPLSNSSSLTEPMSPDTKSPSEDPSSLTLGELFAIFNPQTDQQRQALEQIATTPWFSSLTMKAHEGGLWISVGSETGEFSLVYCSEIEWWLHIGPNSYLVYIEANGELYPSVSEQFDLLQRVPL
jgi:hypothetical protein